MITQRCYTIPKTPLSDVSMGFALSQAGAGSFTGPPDLTLAGPSANLDAIEGIPTSQGVRT